MSNSWQSPAPEPLPPPEATWGQPHPGHPENQWHEPHRPYEVPPQAHHPQHPHPTQPAHPGEQAQPSGRPYPAEPAHPAHPGEQPYPAQHDQQLHPAHESQLARQNQPPHPAQPVHPAHQGEQAQPGVRPYPAETAYPGHPSERPNPAEQNQRFHPAEQVHLSHSGEQPYPAQHDQRLHLARQGQLARPGQQPHPAQPAYLAEPARPGRHTQQAEQAYPGHDGRQGPQPYPAQQGSPGYPSHEGQLARQGQQPHPAEPVRPAHQGEHTHPARPGRQTQQAEQAHPAHDERQGQQPHPSQQGRHGQPACQAPESHTPPGQPARRAQPQAEVADRREPQAAPGGAVGGRRAKRRAERGAAPGPAPERGGAPEVGRGAGRRGTRTVPRARRAAHRRAGLVKVVAFCAATAAGSMLLLRGNEALDRLGSPTVPDSATAAPAAAVDPPDPGRVLQVVAHPDDDLYFMNPDLRYSISAGHPVTSVYLTAGEADGINATAGKAATTRPNKPAYAEARQNGIRAAYALMATGDRSSPWQRTLVPTKGGGHAEVDVLTAKPQVNLVWLQLREAGTVYDDAPDSLHGLWDGRIPRLESMLASGTPVKQRFSYTKDQVVQTLVGILEQYRPTTVRSQDPTPGRFPDTKRYTDHQDHFYGARFVQLATAAYAKDVKDRPHFAVQNYVGYVNGSLPTTLDPAEAKEKLDILGAYAWLDRQNHCKSDAGCGDLKVSDQPGGNHWSESINYARGTGTTWLTSDKDLGLWAFKVLDGQVALWHRPGLVGRWKGPDLLPGTGMDPGVSTVTLPDGRTAVFGTRTSIGAKPADYRREVVYVVQKHPGAEEFTQWQSLGTPETADDTWTSDISAPAVSVDGAGQLAAYVRDGAGTLRGRVQHADGTWGPWDKHGGSDLHGSPVTATDGAGRRMVFATTSKSVVGWAQPKPGAPLGQVTATGLPDTTLPLTALGREGGVRLWFRRPGSGNVRTALVTAEGGLKVSQMTDLGGLQGFGAVTASGHVLAGRTAGGQLGSEAGPGRPWERSPLMFVGAPSSTPTGRSMVSLAVVGLDARLYVTSSTDAPDAHLAPWQPVGPRNTAP
ncbi:PIG-L family deacetylase [Streptomyces sp. Sge12]|uniref:PIG-L family deacetylase n=1 Tax=Streptomyces sp. Sge12 TaxID=1972846 RepID=UPI001F28E7E5|nr:PIG-L family deacetylase [Streptomyces sp. Sge12]